MNLLIVGLPVGGCTLTGSIFFEEPMNLKERWAKYGWAGLFRVTWLLHEQLEVAEARIRLLESAASAFRRQWDEGQEVWRQAYETQLRQNQELIAQLQGDQTKLLQHFAGVTATEMRADSPAMEEAIEKLLQREMLDPLSAAIRDAQDEDTANYRFRIEEEQAAIRAQLSQMEAQAGIPLIH